MCLFFLFVLFPVEIFSDVIHGLLDVASTAGNGRKGQDGGKGALSAGSEHTVSLIIKIIFSAYLKTEENACKQVTFGFSFTSNWLKK